MRRSSRLRWQMPLRLIGLDESTRVDELCETVVVSAHGCGLRAGRKLDSHVRVQLETPDGRRATAVVVSSHSLGHNSNQWLIGVNLDRPANFWGVPNSPEDWASFVQEAAAATWTGNATHIETGVPDVEKIASPQSDEWQRWRQERAAVELNLQQFMQFLDGFQRRWISAADPLRELPPLREQALEEMRQQLQTVVRETQEKLSHEGMAREALAAAMDSVRLEMDRFQESVRGLQVQFEKIIQAREDTESLARAMPQRVAQHVSQTAAAAFQQWQKQAEGELGGRVRQEVLQCLEQRLPELTRLASSNLREQLAAEWERHRQELARAAQGLTVSLQERGGETLDTLQWQLQAVFDACQDKLQDKHVATEERLQALEKRAGDLVANVDATLQFHAEESLQRTKEELGRLCGTARESYLAQAQGELHRVLAETVHRAADSAEEMRRSLESLEQQSKQHQLATMEVNRQVEHARSWLAQETEHFRRTVHDGFLQAKTEIQEHIQQALEGAHAPLDQRGQEIIAQFDDAARSHQQALSKRSDELSQRWETIQQDSQAASEKALQNRLAEITEAFRQNAYRMVQTTLEQWQSALSQSLNSIRQAMASQLEQPS